MTMIKYFYSSFVMAEDNSNIEYCVDMEVLYGAEKMILLNNIERGDR